MDIALVYTALAKSNKDEFLQYYCRLLSRSHPQKEKPTDAHALHGRVWAGLQLFFQFSNSSSTYTTLTALADSIKRNKSFDEENDIYPAVLWWNYIDSKDIEFEALFQLVTA
mmetsp:Transcript_26473/g.44744  ORF Transcript_26473/g.44744 Transcript_26473/m.44744 type:complete len:112 (+) Transcript_26473:42-377(+)